MPEHKQSKTLFAMIDLIGLVNKQGILLR